MSLFFIGQRLLELEFDVETEVPGAGQHEVVHVLVVVAAGGCGDFGIERSLAVDHPEVAGHEAEGELGLVAEPLLRQRVAQVELLQADVGGVVEVVGAVTALGRGDRLVVGLGAD